jgi:hypothetical protein
MHAYGEFEVVEAAEGFSVIFQDTITEYWLVVVTGCSREEADSMVAVLNNMIKES